VVAADDDTALRLQANLYKLVNVLSVEDISQQQSVKRDLALIKVAVGPDKRAEVLQLCEVFRARPIDLAQDTLIVEITGTQEKIEGLLSVLEPFGIVEMVHAGTVAMTRGPEGRAARSMHQNMNARGVVAA
jgi:acetolactate synthase-1/3 small subunit